MTATYGRDLLKSFVLNNPVYAGATVTAYLADANGDITSTLAELFEEQTGTTQLANPQTLDSQGKFNQPVYFEDAIILIVDSTDVGQQETGVVRPALNTTDIDNARTLALRDLASRYDDDWLLSSTPI